MRPWAMHTDILIDDLGVADRGVVVAVGERVANDAHAGRRLRSRIGDRRRYFQAHSRSREVRRIKA